jgi:hypothetical protein
MKKIAILCAVALISLSLLSFLPVHGEAEIYDSVLRLHVVANSDSELDQSLKLRVRDSVAALVAELTADCPDLDSSCTRVSESLELIEKIQHDRHGSERTGVCNSHFKAVEAHTSDYHTVHSGKEHLQTEEGTAINQNPIEEDTVFKGYFQALENRDLF